MMDYIDRDLDEFIARQIMRDMGSPPYTSSMTETWRLVEKMIQRCAVELKLDMFLGVTGQHWVASFYSPSRCARWEGRGHTAPLAICRAARETFQNLKG
uniref:Phage ABA sandwich domain-containing protein n=1 Tax=Desulfobacca acetoxidans TaxID=60893 RepID=A0A7V4G8A1_9BACT